MRHHVAHDDPRRQRERDALEPKRRDADLDDLRIVAEHGDDGRRKDKADDREHDQHDGGELYAEPECFLDALIYVRTIVKAADRLETLSEADQTAVGKLHDARDDGHARNRGVAIVSGSGIQADGGDAAQPLTEQRGGAAV